MPKEIYNLINLKELHIQYDNLENFPDGIEKLINLESINIRGNLNLKDLPMEEIGKLNNLNELRIKEMKEMKNLINLVELIVPW